MTMFSESFPPHASMALTQFASPRIPYISIQVMIQVSYHIACIYKPRPISIHFITFFLLSPASSRILFPF